ncbi:MAG: TonB-dependent receptor, partial [Nitrospirota bacterium]|nr:TonB-dependent receptor [Nitrospirota bacterium]
MKIYSDTVVALFVALLSSLIVCSTSLAAEPEEMQFAADTVTIRELLLYYDLEELIEVSYRRPTKLKHVAENISVITAEQIRAMNAHSVAEVLNTVPGVRVAFQNSSFGGSAGLSIQNSYYEHVLVLLDGVRLNDVDAGWPETAGIPVQIVDRIEIIKGPASSSWGSALGGVINIVTKNAGENLRPSGSLYGSYGKGSSQDYRADVAGRAGKLRYYFYGGLQESDGLVGDKFFDNKSLYGKITTEITGDVSLTLTGGYWRPDFKVFDLPRRDLNYFSKQENYLATAKLDAALSPVMKLNLGLHFRRLDYTNHSESLATGELYNDVIYNNDLFGGSANLIWTKGRHTMLFGAEVYYGENTYSYRYPSAPVDKLKTQTRKEWAFYFNDTIIWDRLSITPGLRYDHLAISDVFSDDILSPSIGMTYKIEKETLFRASAAHGFMRPAIGLVADDPGFYGNPDLEPEDIWSFQAGVETGRFKNIYLKAAAFYHHTDKTWIYDYDTGNWENGGVSKRTGFELDITASPFSGFTAALGLSYIWVNPYDEKSDDTYSIDMKLNYNTMRFGNMALVGRYFWWPQFDAASGASYHD